ncbi:MAG: hypothetical protein DHS20C14_14890 [Phycisphaeraceae bacterium]|nr:MAG: hypothetical protein DHS20C14_14890 [Phycisphaeraceae bacterium]
MAFATDRDLVVLEPGVFRDAAWTAQRVSVGGGGVSGITLTLSTGGPDFEAVGVGPGMVALIDGAPVEVIERTGASTLTVSRVRGIVEDAPIPLAVDASVKIEVYTFAAVLAGVHRRVLRMLGIEPDGDGSDDALAESAITNPSALARLEALGALHAIYSAASAAGPVGTEMGERAEAYRMRFSDERQRAAARVDLDGDGVPDATRRLNVIQFVRG